ncbi:Eukaryotic initiation factor [Parasponia andersonii]|uniref:RNA helicase n=1 Tax=Parasponia andersonii TaxID=3476 RepID=A0A2P5AXA8_PARAD|nr:Eukaryotic initiation factor [Parasponia andersonii]
MSSTSSEVAPPAEGSQQLELVQYISSCVLGQLDYDLMECQGLVLAPTRELALEAEKVIRELGDSLAVKVHACVDGRSVQQDVSILSGGVHVVVGTPIRVLDMMTRQRLRPDYIVMVVLDEFREIRSRGYSDQVYDILRLLPRPILAREFSATTPPAVARNFVNNPVSNLVKRDELTREAIKHYHVNIEREEWKFETLCDFYETLAISADQRHVIFVNTKHKVDWLTEQMRARDHTVSAIHEDMDQNAKDVTMREFRSRSCPVLVTTDMLAHGDDVQQASLVINYDLPTRPEYYLHRVGRIGRFGRKGMTMNFVIKDDERMISSIQKFYNVQIDELPPNIADLL